MYGGLADRMQKEITALAPSSMKVKVSTVHDYQTHAPPSAGKVALSGYSNGQMLTYEKDCRPS